MTDPLDLAGLLVARICHDLAGPAGALANGAELIADEPDSEIRAEFVQMIADGAGKIGARLRFIRLAFGGPAGGPDIAADEARTALGGFMAGEGRLELDWRASAAVMQRDFARLLLTLAMCVGEAVEGRGTLIVDDDAAGAAGSRVNLRSEARAVLEGAVLQDLPSSVIAPALAAAALARRLNMRPCITASPGWLRIALERA